MLTDKINKANFLYVSAKNDRTITLAKNIQYKDFNNRLYETLRTLLFIPTCEKIFKKYGINISEFKKLLSTSANKGRKKTNESLYTTDIPCSVLYICFIMTSFHNINNLHNNFNYISLEEGLDLFDKNNMLNEELQEIFYKYKKNNSISHYKYSKNKLSSKFHERFINDFLLVMILNTLEILLKFESNTIPTEILEEIVINYNLSSRFYSDKFEYNYESSNYNKSSQIFSNIQYKDFRSILTIPDETIQELLQEKTINPFLFWIELFKSEHKNQILTEIIDIILDLYSVPIHPKDASSFQKNLLNYYKAPEVNKLILETFTQLDIIKKDNINLDLNSLKDNAEKLKIYLKSFKELQKDLNYFEIIDKLTLLNSIYDTVDQLNNRKSYLSRININKHDTNKIRELSVIKNSLDRKISEIEDLFTKITSYIDSKNYFSDVVQKNYIKKHSNLLEKNLSIENLLTGNINLHKIEREHDRLVVTSEIDIYKEVYEELYQNKSMINYNLCFTIEKLLADSVLVIINSTSLSSLKKIIEDNSLKIYKKKYSIDYPFDIYKDIFISKI